jgi:glutaredoxin
MKNFLALLAALLTCLVAPAAAQYRWVDKDGKVTYGDSPPPSARDVRSLGKAAGSKEGDSGVALPYELRRAVERSPVVLYTSADCQPCGVARDFLRARGVPHAEKTVTTPADLDEMRRVTGNLRLPYLAVGGQNQTGFNPDAWNAMLDAAGYPRGSMLPRAYSWPAASPLAPAAEQASAGAVQAAPGSSAQEPARK